MPTAKLQVVNPAGTLLIDKSGFGLNYLGKAAYASTVPRYNPDGENGGSGHSLYTFTSATPIVPFITIPSGRTVYMKYMQASGSTWTIAVYCGSTPTDSLGLETQYDDAEVFVFGRKAVASGSIGLRMKDDDGNLTYALTDADLPVSIRKHLAIADASYSPRAIPTLGKPAVHGFPASYRHTSAALGGGFFRNTIYEFGFMRDGASALILSDVVEDVSRDDGVTYVPIPPGAVTYPVASDVFIIDAAGLT